MTHYPHDPRFEAETGTPTVEVWIRNVRAQPIGDDVLRLRLADHPSHGAAIDALEEHGLSREVVLCLDGTEYQYVCEVGDGDDIYLAPSDDFENDPPPPDRFLERALNLRLRW